MPASDDDFRDYPEERIRREKKTIGSISERSPAEVEEEIARIRAELDDTLEKIEHRLSPEELLERLLGRLQAPPGDYLMEIARVIRENPIPAAVAGAGLAWLGASAARSGPVAVRNAGGASWSELLSRGAEWYRQAQGGPSSRTRSRARTASSRGRRGKTVSRRYASSPEAEETLRPILILIAGMLMGAAAGSALPHLPSRGNLRETGLQEGLATQSRRAQEQALREERIAILTGETPESEVPPQLH